MNDVAVKIQIHFSASYDVYDDHDDRDDYGVLYVLYIPEHQSIFLFLKPS